MICITGDTHGEFNRISDFCYDYETTDEDILIILGDVGVNYNLDESDEELKEELEELPITLFCIHGNHEERPFMIEGYQEKMWHKGIVYYEEEYPNILFAKDGEIYDFNGKKAIVIGGAYSVDKYYRLSGGMPWFETEQPSDEIKDYVEQKLDEVGWKVDFVFSHTAPLKYESRDEFLPNINQSMVDKSTEEWLDFIEEHLDYGKWYLGHYHCERIVNRIEIMFEDIKELNDIGGE